MSLSLKKSLIDQKDQRTVENSHQMEVHKIAIKMLLRVDEFKDDSDELKIFPQQIKLLNLMKIIVDAQWIIDRPIFSEMLVLTGYMDLID